jgi:inner membrane transporter RhtA
MNRKPFAFANCAPFMLYVILGHKIANSVTNTSDDAASDVERDRPTRGGVLIAVRWWQRLGIGGAVPAFVHPSWLLWAIAIGRAPRSFLRRTSCIWRLPRATSL